MTNTLTPTDRTRLVGRIMAAYTDLGWALPTSIENASIGALYRTINCANETLVTRGLVQR